MGALAQIPASAADTTLSYLDVRTTRELVAKDEKLYMNFESYLLPEFGQFRYEGGESLRAVYGFDEQDLGTAISVGQPGEEKSGNRLTGNFDTDAISEAFAKRDYRAEKTGYGVHLVPGDGRDVQASGDVLVLGEPGSGLSPSPAKGKTVADDPAYRAVAECLGEKPYQSSFFGKQKGTDAQLIAIGGQIGKDGTPTESLCAAAASKSAAQDIVKKLQEKTVEGERYSGSEVKVTEGELSVVSMTWKNSAKSGMRPADELKILDLPLLLMK